MNNTTPWLQAARLRTLPLAASGIICGAALAWYHGSFNWLVSGLALLTALLLQVLSNFANDYGDASKGTDNEQRVGPERAVQSGALSLKQMKQGMVVMAIKSFISGILLVFVAIQSLPEGSWIVFLILGLAAIVAAILYTVGKKAYGYHGLGDVMVFLFFGLASVVGTYYLNTGKLMPEAWMIGASMGLLSTAVLNLNNMRDIDNDIACGKMTLAAKMGFTKAKIYHSVLVYIGFLIMYFVLLISNDNATLLNALIVLPIIIVYKNNKKIRACENKAELDPFLKRQAIATFLLSLIFSTILVMTKTFFA